MQLVRLGIIIFLFTICNQLFSEKFWLTTYEFPYGPKTGIALIDDSVLFVGTEDRVIKSTNSGYHFTESLKAKSIYTIFVSRTGKVYAGGKGVIYKTENLGITWDSVSVNNNYPVIRNYPVVQIIENSQGKLFAITNGYDIDREEMSGDNVLFSDNEGQSWSTRNTGLKPYGGCNKIVVDKNDRLYVAVVDDNITGAGGLYVSINDGLNWTQTNVSYDGLDAIPGSPRILQISGMSLLKNDSLYVSFEGIAVNTEVRLNVRKHIDHVLQNNLWNVDQVSNIPTWWLDRPLNNIYQARNGDLYSSYSSKMSTGGTYFKKYGNYPWARIDTGLGLDVTGVRTHQYFAEASNGKVYMIQMYDERIYWADTSKITTRIPEHYSNQQLFYCPTQVLSGTNFEIKTYSDYTCNNVEIYDLSGKIISSTKFTNMVSAPENRGIYLIAVKVDNKKYFRKLLVN